METTLLLTDHHSSCSNTQQVWLEACSKKEINLTVIYFTDSNGQSLAKKLNLKSFPALIHNNKVVAVGHPNQQKAEEIIMSLT